MTTLMQTSPADDQIAAAQRLVEDVELAVAQGAWGSSEASRLHSWLRADMMPWALAQMRRHRDPGRIGSLLRDLLAHDAQLVTAVGEDLVRVAEQLEVRAIRLASALR